MMKPGGLLLSNDLEREAAGRRRIDRPSVARAARRQRRQGGKLALDADVEVFQVLADDDVVDPRGVVVRRSAHGTIRDRALVEDDDIGEPPLADDPALLQAKHAGG